MKKTLNFPDRSKYIGEIKNDKRNGYGTEILKMEKNMLEILIVVELVAIVFAIYQTSQN